MKKVLQGVGVSTGKATGNVRIIKNIDDKEFNKGDILVTEITNPSMVILIAKSAGIICNIGGMTSHPSIICRELGIPCIVSAKHIKTGKKATEVLKDGMKVLIDGATGEVYEVNNVDR